MNEENNNSVTVRVRTSVNPPSEPPKKSGSHWFLWWVFRENELEDQATSYSSDKLGSYRGISALLLLLAIAVNIVFIYMGWVSSFSWVDIAIFALLAIFIYRGHRWAMIIVMLLWTIEKIFQVVTLANQSSTFPVIFILIWWTTYMHAFYGALRVENLHRKLIKTTTVRHVQHVENN